MFSVFTNWHFNLIVICRKYFNIFVCIFSYIEHIFFLNALCLKNILCILHNYRQIICFYILSDNLYIVYILSDNYLRHRQGDFLGKSSIFIKFPAKVCEICFGIPFFLYKGLGFLIRRFLFLEIKRFLFFIHKERGQF